MTLFELARELFTYLVRFREKASSTAAPPLPEVRRDLLGIFARMDNQAKRDPLLMDPYHQVHYALVGLADEVVLTSGWEHSPAWRKALLEERFYNTQEAGSRFFELANNLGQAPQDVVAIFYLCLALGFSGRYAPADPELAEVKDKLLARLPSKPRIMEEPPSTGSQEGQVRKWLWSGVGLVAIVFMVVLGWNYWQTAQTMKSGAPPVTASKPAPGTPKVKTEVAPPPNPEVSPQKMAKAEPITKTEANTEATPKTGSKVETASTQAPQAKAEKIKVEPQEPKPPKAKEQLKEIAQAESGRQPSETPQAKPASKASAPAAIETKTAAAGPAPPETTKTPAPAKPAPQEKTYRVRVGVYVGPIQSGRFADTLKKDGYPVSVEKLERPGGKVLYVVSITPLASLDDAERVQAEVKDKYKVSGVLKQD